MKNAKIIELSIKKMTIRDFTNIFIYFQTVWNNLFEMTDRN
jgi:hypothetical protein